MLSVVQQVEDVDEFYLPFNIDFRGRMYPLSDYLSPQGDDLSKALLQFARKKPLGPEGWKALAIHGANCMADDPFTGQKLDKLSLDDRIAWVKQNSSRIVETALDHWNTRGWWDAADKPFMFYAFCCEWSRYLAQGDTLMSGLPVSMDGSCNGIQHFSAMFRDEKAAKAVNVISNGWPEDLYSVVAEDVLRQVTRDAGNTDEVEADLAHRWLKSGLINRKLCKRPTMTFGYGSKRYGFTDQLRHYLAHDCDAEQRACFVNVEKNVMQQACRYMASRIWDSLKVTVQSAHQGMGWMQKLAQAAVKTGKPMRWYSPTRLLIVQEYYVPQVKKINTVLAGNLTVQPRYYVPTSEVVAHKQINGIAPNFIHSLDAAALCFTVVAAKEAGIESFGMVHDSFGTVAGDYHKLGEITREQFVRMYSECDVVGSLMQDVYHLTGPDEELPQPPKEGNLKLEEVLDSKYFFC
jgi:DNA-directed RNA polymerase